MKLVIQRVAHASVEAEGVLSGRIGRGLMLLLGVEQGDTLEQAKQLATKVLKLRLWPDLKDPAKQWATSVVDGGYEVLVVSQFTLFATFKKPKPDFHQAMGGDDAKALYEAFVRHCRQGLGDPERVATGVFGAMMQVDIRNDGPVTVELVANSLQQKQPGASPSEGGSAVIGGEASPAGRPSKKSAAHATGSGLSGEVAANGMSTVKSPFSPEDETLLQHQPYFGGFTPARLDAERFSAFGSADMVPPEVRSMPNLLRWFEHVASFSKGERESWPPR